MSEEERKAIEDITREITDEDRKEYMSKWFLDDLTILIKLINKQNLKINELKGDIEGLKLSIKDRDKLIEKNDKVIDEMAGYLAIIRDCPNEDKGANIDCENRCSTDDDIYAECWKMYFERKLKNER